MLDDCFFYVTDIDGDIPRISKHRPNSEKVAWVKYIKNKPVEIYPYQNQDRVWDYSENTMYGLFSNIPSYENKYLPIFNGKIHDRTFPKS
jgi:hypothetical protein